MIGKNLNWLIRVRAIDLTLQKLKMYDFFLTILLFKFSNSLFLSIISS